MADSAIYFATNKDDFVIKCYPSDEIVTSGETFARALKEYSFLRIAGAIGVSPQISRNNGFDMVFYNDCVEFAMERCVDLR